MITAKPPHFTPTDSICSTGDLTHFPYLFTAEEKIFIDRWGEKALAIQRGEESPRTEKERIFLEVCEGRRGPETKFHYLWLRFRQAVAAEEAFIQLVGLRNELDSHRENLSRVEAAHKAVWRHLEEVKLQFESQLHCAGIREKELLRSIQEYKKKLGIIDDKKTITSIEPEICGNDWREQK